MSRKFIGRKEVAFIHTVNKELIQNVVGQEVFYYGILADKTTTNDLYNESVNKAYAPPVKCNALVMYENTQSQIGALPPDAKFNLDIYFHQQEIDERNISPKLGDFVLFDSIMFEIYQVTQSQLIYGMIDQKMMTRCTCGPARKGQFAPKKQPEQRLKHDSNAPKYSEQPSQRAYTADPRNKK